MFRHSECVVELAAAPRVAIPDHELIQCIGRGSYGDVWLARSMMGQFRAVKIIFASRFKDQRPFERELQGIRTFEPVSRSHEGFVDVLHAGRNESEGYFYYVMELGDDRDRGQEIDPASYVPRTLASELQRRGRLPAQECLQYALTLSSALSHLHAKGLIHRDVKPSNIIFVDGVPKLADIGLVSEISEARSYVGTEGFIAPDGPNTPQSDVFSFGKVLYEIGTGKDRQEFPELPNEVSSFPDAADLMELNEVILRACAYDLTRRYQSARELNADLVLLASGKSVQRLRFLERQISRLKRIIAVALIVGIVVISVYWSVEGKRKAVAESRHRQAGAQIAYGSEAMRSGDYVQALLHFTEAAGLDRENAARTPTHLLRLNTVLAQCPKLEQMLFMPGRVNSVNFIPGGTALLATEWLGRVCLLDSTEPGRMTTLAETESLLEISAASPDGKHIAAGYQSGVLLVWQTGATNPLYRLQHPGRVYGVKFSRSGRLLASASDDGHARVWNMSSGGLVQTLSHSNAVLCVDFTPDEQLVATAGRDGTARLWNLETGAAAGNPLVHESWVLWVSFSPDGKRVATGSFDRKAKIWRVPSGEEIGATMEHGDAVRTACFSPDGQILLTASWDRTARLWDGRTGLPISPNGVLRHSERVTHASFDEDGHRIVTGCVDGTIRVWNLAGAIWLPKRPSAVFSANGLRRLEISTNGIVVSPSSQSDAALRVGEASAGIEARLSDDGGHVVVRTAGTNATLTVVNAKSGKRATLNLQTPISSLNQVRLNADGNVVATFDSAAVEAWDVAAKRALPSPSKIGRIDDVVLAPRGNTVLLVSGNSVHGWDFSRSAWLFTPIKRAANIKAVAFSPDGTRFAVCCADESLSPSAAQVLDLHGRLVCQPLQHRDGVLFAAFSSDSRQLLTCSEDFSVVVWDIATGNPVTAPLLHGSQVLHASFSHGEDWIVTTAADRTVRIWDGRAGDMVSPPLRHEQLVQRVCFTDQNGGVVASRLDGNSWIWHLPPLASMSLEDYDTTCLLLASPSRQSSPPSHVAHELEVAWKSLSARFPDLFSTSREQRITWHTQQATAAERMQRSAAALFHYNRLATLDPNNGEWQTRARATEQKTSRR